MHPAGQDLGGAGVEVHGRQNTLCPEMKHSGQKLRCWSWWQLTVQG